MTLTLQMDQVSFEIFSDLEYRDDDGTLVVFPPDVDFANLSCSVTSIFREGVELREVAEQEIPELAAEAGVPYEVFEDKFVLHTLKPSSEDAKSTIHFWHVGLGGHIAIISVYIDYRFANDPQAKRMLECADLLIRTFRRSEND